MENQNQNWRMHHSGETYEVANSKAADWARDRFEKQIEAGKASAAHTIATIAEMVPEDAIVAGRALAFVPSKDGVNVAWAGDEHGLHRNAFKQVVGKTPMNAKFADALTDGNDADRELLAYNLNDLYRRANRRHFMRSVKGQVRGCLSDRYAPYDSAQIVDAVLGEFQSLGVLPLNGTATDTRWSIKGVLPMVFEPFADEIMTYGLDITNSDFGNGAFHVRLFGNRVACTNLMTTEDGLRKVHLGGKLSDDFTFSRETYELNSKALISATRDTVQGLLGPGKVNAMNAVIATAHEGSLGWKDAKRKLTALTKSELTTVQESFEGADVLNLPPGKSAWRLSNAVSWLAVNTDNDERKLDLQRVAGAVIEQ